MNKAFFTTVTRIADVETNSFDVKPLAPIRLGHRATM